MGFVWDLIQQSQLADHRAETETLEARVGMIEQDVQELREIMGRLLRRLEERFGEDVDGDGRVGGA